MKHVIELKPVY